MFITTEVTTPPSDVLAMGPRDAARALGVSAPTLSTHTKSGEIPHVRLGRRILYPVDALRDWMKRTMTGGGAAAKS